MLFHFIESSQVLSAFGLGQKTTAEASLRLTLASAFSSVAMLSSNDSAEVHCKVALKPMAPGHFVVTKTCSRESPEAFNASPTWTCVR